MSYVIYLSVLFVTSGNCLRRLKRDDQSCIVISDIRDSEQKRCQVLKCYQQKVIVCQPSDGNIETFTSEGQYKQNFTPMTGRPDYDGSNPLTRPLLGSGTFNWIRKVAYLMQRDPSNAFFEYFDSVLKWIMNWVFDRSFQAMFDIFIGRKPWPHEPPREKPVKRKN